MFSRGLLSSCQRSIRGLTNRAYKAKTSPLTAVTTAFRPSAYSTPFRYLSAMTEIPKFTNRLAKEKSPYLLVRSVSEHMLKFNSNRLTALHCLGYFSNTVRVLGITQQHTAVFLTTLTNSSSSCLLLILYST
jgi:hypothetical protein